MAASIPAFVEPLLWWARESIDLTQVAAPHKIGVPDDACTCGLWPSAHV
jgi:hypothetical protein